METIFRHAPAKLLIRRSLFGFHLTDWTNTTYDYPHESEPYINALIRCVKDGTGVPVV